MNGAPHRHRDQASGCQRGGEWWGNGKIRRKIAAAAAAAAVKSCQSCPTLCDPIDGSPTGSSVPGILQASSAYWLNTYYTPEVPDCELTDISFHLPNNFMK